MSLIARELSFRLGLSKAELVEEVSGQTRF
jgi:hypothetical protein